jgi:hypothetical protein
MTAETFNPCGDENVFRHPLETAHAHRDDNACLPLITNSRMDSVSDHPTDEAIRFFYNAQKWFNNSKGLGFKDNPHIGNIIAGLAEMATAHQQMATGLRATYLLLEEVNRKLDTRWAKT